MRTAFDYMYRDAGNFKAFGSVMLDGRVDTRDRQLIRERLSSGEFFIAEQVGIPALYRELYKWSGGPTKDDHCWHEFIGFREISEPPEQSAAMSASELVKRLAAIEDWNEGLSPHFWIEIRL